MDFTWILIAATFAITLFLGYVRMKDLFKHRALLKTVAEKEKLIETIKRPGQKVTFFIFVGATLIFGVLAFFTPDPATSLAYIAVFIVLGYTEWDNVKTIETISVFERSVVFGTNEYRIKSIRAITASGRKSMRVAMLDGTGSIVPNDVGEKLLALIKARKAK